MERESIYRRLQERRYIIAETITDHGVFRLWESNRHGDEVQAIVTLNHDIIGRTWDDLQTFIEDYLEA